MVGWLGRRIRPFLTTETAQSARSGRRRLLELLLAWGQGDLAALEELTPVVYDELRRLARHYLGHERVGHTLQATALVNEAYLHLVDIHKVQWQNRAHFFAMSARLMRRILVDSARSRKYQKRGARRPESVVG